MNYLKMDLQTYKFICTCGTDAFPRKMIYLLSNLGNWNKALYFGGGGGGYGAYITL